MANPKANTPPPPSLRRVQRWTRPVAIVGLAAWFNGAAAVDQPKTTYADQVLPLVEQHCAKCHNPDKKKGDLDLTTHAGVLKGGGTGPVVVSGQPDASKLIKALTHGEEPFMPPNKPPIADREIAVFKSWIAGGLLETSGSKAVAAAKPAADLTLKVSVATRPDGPPPMPRDLPIDPVVHTRRPGTIQSLATSPWAPLIAIAAQKQILLYNSTNHDLLAVFPFPNGQPELVRFSHNGRLLLAAGGHGASSGRATLWEVESGRLVASVGREYDSILAADLSPDQAKIAVGGPDRLIKLYASGSGELLQKIKKHTDWITALAFSPDGQMLATGDRNGGISVWDPETGQELFTTAGHKSSVTGLSWRIDSKLLASSSEDGTIKLWESTEGKQSKSWNAHPHVLDVAYSRDGRLASCGRDGAVTVWEANGNKGKTMTVPGEMALHCAWTHDDAAVVAGDFAGNVLAWDAKSGRSLGPFESNPAPLAEQVNAARQALSELLARTNKVATPLAAARTEAEARTAAFQSARAASEKATADFRAKAEVVARLKETATKPNPPADVAAQLTAARAAREAARAVSTNTVAAALSASNQMATASIHLREAEKLDLTAELAAARVKLARLEEAAKRRREK